MPRKKHEAGLNHRKIPQIFGRGTTELILATLLAEGALSVVDLSTRTSLDKLTTTRVMRRLLHANLITVQGPPSRPRQFGLNHKLAVYPSLVKALTAFLVGPDRPKALFQAENLSSANEVLRFENIDPHSIRLPILMAVKRLSPVNLADLASDLQLEYTSARRSVIELEGMGLLKTMIEAPHRLIRLNEKYYAFEGLSQFLAALNRQEADRVQAARQDAMVL